MRERVTFFHPPGTGPDPAHLEIQGGGLLGPVTEAVREDRLTMALDELPDEISSVLQTLSELHIHWASPFAYDTLEPFSSRLSPGFHLSFFPLPQHSHDAAKLCGFLQLFGPLDCFSGEAFTSVGQGWTAEPQLVHFYQELDDMQQFVNSLTTDGCPELDSVCRARARSLLTIASLDITYDSGSNQLTLTAFWPFREHHIAVPGAAGRRRTEVGILSRATKDHLANDQIAVSGLLVVLGENRRPSPTRFDLSSHHWLSNATFTASFKRPSGLHPTLLLDLSSNKAPVDEGDCAAYVYLTLPRTIFADRYQLAHELFLASKNLSALRYTTLPVDLEAPAYATKVWGSNVLLELAPPRPTVVGGEGAWSAEIPLHLRYLKPAAGGQVATEVPYPAVFWACGSGQAADASSLFDRSRLGYDELFAPGTVLYHVSPGAEKGSRLSSAISVPVLRQDAASWVGWGTGLAVALGFGWVLWKLVAVYARTGYGDVARREAEAEKKRQ